jgi:hypothetical protein
MTGAIPAMGSYISDHSNSPLAFPGNLSPIKKVPAKVKVAFLYPPAEVVIAGEFEDSWAPNNWFTWPGNQFEPERQEKLFTSKISEIAGKLGIDVSFESKAIYQKAKVDEFIRRTKDEKPDAVLIVNFVNSLRDWSFEMATKIAPAAIVYQPVGANHQLPPENLMNTKGIYYIHSIENWDEIERGLLAVRAKKMLAQSRLIRISDQGQTPPGRERSLGVEIVDVSADEFNSLFDSIKADNILRKEAMEFKKKARLVMDVEDSFIIDGIRSHHSVKSIIWKYGADAITIRCLMLKHRKPCMSFSINNGNLIPCGCENDLNATLTLMLGRWMFERAGFQHNPEFDTSENLYFGAHCTCPTKMKGPNGPELDYLIRPFFHQLPKTAALDVQLIPGEPLLLVKYSSENHSLGCYTGKVIESPKSPPTGGCATRVLAGIDKLDNITECYIGPHPILYLGDRGDARRLKAFSQLYDLNLKSNI